MKTFIRPFFTLLIIITTLSGIALAGEKTELQWMNLTEGLKKAESSKKKVIIDVYTDWCKWCVKMDQDVYGNDNISKYLSKQYILVKLNAESSAKVTYKGSTVTETEIAAQFGVTGYPTTLFLESNGDFLTPVNGYVPPERFIDIVKYIGDGHYQTMNWDEYQKKKDGTTKK